MVMEFPLPGRGYVIREYLGGGFWKRAFRASSTRSTADVALLYPHDDKRSDVLLRDVENLIRGAGGHEFSDYLAQFHGLERGEDGKLFIVEELLDRPLDKLNPLNDLGLFSRIARDLSRGLCCLHENSLVHRDLKLDNCGMDQLQRAKIFDLGSVTSEPGGIEGTIFTRAPELFVSPAAGSLFDKHNVSEPASPPADIWALGATLFALKGGKYPFVHENEVEARRRLNTKIATKSVKHKDALESKKQIDKSIAARVTKHGAFEDLKERVQSILRGRAGEILISMLDRQPDRRLKAREYEGMWAQLCNELGGAGPLPAHRPDKWAHIERQLAAIDQLEFSLTTKQLETLIAELHQAQLDARDASNQELFDRIEGLLRKIKRGKVVAA